MKIISSVSIADNPTHACVTDSNRWGHGVFSWHTSKVDAQNNATVTGGRCLPVDYIDGELITPSLATRIVGRRIGAV